MSSTLPNLPVHIVFTTKGREPIICKEKIGLGIAIGPEKMFRKCDVQYVLDNG